jgi:hypothetical protein
MSHRKANFNKAGSPIQGSKKLRLGEGSKQKSPPNYLMLILSFIVELLTSVLSTAKNRKNRLNP